MARVVQRRGGPPYLPILLAFLFLVSTTLAVMFYLRNDEKTKDVDSVKNKNFDLVKKNAKNGAFIKKLVMEMTGQSMSPDAAISESEDRLELDHAKGYPNLSSAVSGLNGKIVDLINQIEQEKSTSSRLRGTIAERDKTIDKIKDDLTKEVDDVGKELTKARRRFQSGLTARDAQLQRVTDEHKDILKKKDQRITALAAEIDGKDMNIRQQDVQIHSLLEEVRKLKGKAGETGDITLRKPDGKIAKVLLEKEICYINLGQRDRVAPGLTFSVYSARTGIQKGADPKAKIVVVNIDQTTSECRVVEASKDEPIIENDLIINLVFSPTRTYNFVVEGAFDLYGLGRIDPLASRRVRALIKRFGGKVDEVVSVNTDYVVMGVEPRRPPKPPEDAPAVVWRIYNEQMEEYNHFKQVKLTAVSLRIPVLNTNRFLALSGHLPKKRLID